jgi:hypothetical protein
MNDWLDEFRQWDYSLMPVWNWISETLAFHIQNNGIWGYVACAVVVIAIGLSIDELRHTVSMLVSNMIKAVTGIITVGGGVVLGFVTSSIWKGLWTSIFRLFKRDKSPDGQ